MHESAARQIERLAVELASLDRAALVGRLRHCDCGFPLDFSEAFLAEVSLERLRHIALAAAVQAIHHREEDAERGDTLRTRSQRIA